MTAPARARRVEKVSEVVAREIVRDLRGRAADTKLPSEAEMLATYRVGRASLREALRLLEVQGIILIRTGPRGGPVIAERDSRHFARMVTLYLHVEEAAYRDVIEARFVMEPVMARLAASRPDHADLGTIVEEEGTAFHAAVCGLSGNPVLDLMGRALKDVYTDRIEGLVFPADLQRRVQDDHTAITEAIVAGRPAQAERLMRAHMEELVHHSLARDPGVLDEIVGWR